MDIFPSVLADHRATRTCMVKDEKANYDIICNYDIM